MMLEAYTIAIRIYVITVALGSVICILFAIGIYCNELLRKRNEWRKSLKLLLTGILLTIVNAFVIVFLVVCEKLGGRFVSFGLSKPIEYVHFVLNLILLITVGIIGWVIYQRFLVKTNHR